MFIIEKKDTHKWIIALTDGEDNSSKITYDEILELSKFPHRVLINY